jgi:hypothetical protein
MRGSVRSWLYATEVSIYSCARDANDHRGPDRIDKCVNTSLDVMRNHVNSAVIGLSFTGHQPIGLDELALGGSDIASPHYA